MKKKAQIILLFVLCALLIAAIWGGITGLEERYSGKIIEKEKMINAANRRGNEALAFNRKLAARLDAEKARGAKLKENYENIVKKRPKKQKLPALCANVSGAVVTDRVLHQMCELIRSQLLLIGNMEKSEVTLIEINGSLESENKILEKTAKSFETAAIEFNTAYTLQVELTGMKVKKEKKKHSKYFIAGVLLGAAVYAIVRK